MARITELTLEQVKKSPSCFFYIWADEDKFLKYMDSASAAKIRAKKYNQIKVLKLSADKYKVSYDTYRDAVRDAFKAEYNMLPFEALVKLASGGEVAGKNWKAGIYGVGATYTNNFAGVTTSDGKNITVDPDTGHIMLSGNDVTNTSKTNYKEINGAAKEFQLFYEDEFGYTYQSQYDESTGKYYASSWSDDDGNIHSANTGNISSASDGASIWGNVELFLGKFQKILQWILYLFGINTSDASDQLTAENTLPSQQEDGFVVGSGTLEASGILVALAAAGLILANSGKKSKK